MSPRKYLGWMVITAKANDISEHKLDKLARAFHKVRFFDHFSLLFEKFRVKNFCLAKSE